MIYLEGAKFGNLDPELVSVIRGSLVRDPCMEDYLHHLEEHGFTDIAALINDVLPDATMIDLIGFKVGAVAKLRRHFSSLDDTSPRRESSVCNPPARWDFFIGHSRRSGQATTLATKLFSDLTAQGFTCWHVLDTAKHNHYKRG